MFHKENPEYNRRQVGFYTLDELVPKDHFLRKVEETIDFSFIYNLVEDSYSSDNGRPSLDPVLLVKIPLIQCFYGIRSMRQTIKDIEVNTAYRWFLGLSLDDKVPHFTTYGKNYSRRFQNKEVLAHIFSHVLHHVLEAGLIDPSEIFIDGTHIKAAANNHKYKTVVIDQKAKFMSEQLEIEINLEVTAKIQKENSSLEETIEVSKELLSSKDKPLDENLTVELKNEVSIAEKKKQVIPKIKKKTSDINKQVKSLKKPINYSTEIKHLKDKNQKYSTSVKQLKQITNPSNTFVESRLKEIDTISDVQSATEDNDPNQGLNKQGSYTAAVYFSDNEVTNPFAGADLVAKGTDAGGCVEVYKTAEDAKKRNDYLSAFDGLVCQLLSTLVHTMFMERLLFVSQHH